MDVTEEQIARVYAQAFMDVAAKSPNATALVEEVGVARRRRARTAFRSSKRRFARRWCRSEEKEQMLDRVFGSRASPTVLNFLKVLVAARPAGAAAADRADPEEAAMPSGAA